MECCYTSVEWKFSITIERICRRDLGFRPLREFAGRSEEMLADRTFIRIMLMPVIVTQQMQLKRYVCDHRHKADSHDHKNAFASRNTHFESSNPQGILLASIRHTWGIDLRVGLADGE